MYRLQVGVELDVERYVNTKAGQDDDSDTCRQQLSTSGQQGRNELSS